MNKQELSANDWAAERGEKWCEKLSGMEAMLAPVNGALIEALKLDAPCRIAEVGCGGGGTAFEILRTAEEGSTVHGYDINSDLIKAARGRISAGDESVAFQIADMESTLPLARPYDRLVSRFGILFFSDEQAGFQNLSKWLAPGGRFAFAVWGPSEDNPWIRSGREVVSNIIELPQPDPDAPGPFRYADSEKFLKLLDRAGFAELVPIPWRGKLQMGGGLPAEQAAHFALDSISSFSEMLQEAGQGAYEKAHDMLAELYSSHEKDGVVSMDACVHIVTGTRVRRAGSEINIKLH